MPRLATVVICEPRAEPDPPPFAAWKAAGETRLDWAAEAGRLERVEAPVPRGGVTVRFASWVEGFGTEAVEGAFTPLETKEGVFPSGFAPGFATGFGAGFGAATDPRDPVEERLAMDEEGLEAGFGAGATRLTCEVLDPREAIEGFGLETGLGAT